MTTETDLLPCPFCGSENIDPKGWASTDSAGPACDDCGAGAGGVRGTLQDNIAAWNRRANVAHATAPLQAEIEALRAEVERLRSINSALCRKSNSHLIDAARWEERAERLAEAGRRVTAAFRAHGSNITPDGGRTRAECEAAMLALDAALEQEAGRG